MNIYEKLLTISSELNTLNKNLEVGTGKSSYKAVGESIVLDAVKPLELKHKVYSYPVSRRVIESGVLENEVTVNGTPTIKKNLYERIETIYRFVNIEKPEEYVDIVSYGDGIDSQDKSVGKAMTYADKYALMKAYKIVTGDDPDKDASQPLKNAEVKKTNNEKPNETLKKKCDELNIDLGRVAQYLGKSVIELTNDDLKFAIQKTIEAMNKNANI